MGRSLSQPDTNKIIGTFVAGEILSPGDIGVLTEGGTVRKRIPTLAIAKENNNTAGPVTNIAYTTIMSGLSTISYAWSDKLAVLGNGNIAFAAVGASNYPVMWIANGISGALLKDKSVITSNAVGTDVQLLRLNSTSFAVLWDQGNFVYMATFLNDGTPVLAPTQLCAIPAGSTYIQFGGAVVLANGEVLVTVRAVDNNITGYRYNTSGVLQGTTPTIVTLTTNTTGYAIPLAAGGFLYAYLGDSQIGMFLQKYDATGAKVGATVTVFNSGVSHSNLGSIAIRKRAKVVELTGGNIAVMYTTSSGTAGNYFTTYTSALEVITSNVQVGTDGTDYVGCLCQMNDGFAALTNSKIAVFNSSGALQTSFSVSVTGGHLNYSASKLFYNGANFVFGVWGTDLTNSLIGMDEYTPAGNRVGSALTILASGSYGYTSGCFDTIQASGQLVSGMSSSSGSNYSFGTYLSLRSSIVGIVQSSAASGADVQIGTAGNFTLTANEINLGNFDATANYVPGTRGIIAGKSAYLLAIK